MLVVGWNKLTLLSGEDGQAIITLHLQDCHPVAPVLVQDFTGDGWNDDIITCSDKYKPSCCYCWYHLCCSPTLSYVSVVARVLFSPKCVCVWCVCVYTCARQEKKIKI